jgi:hypothetical protein
MANNRKVGPSAEVYDNQKERDMAMRGNGKAVPKKPLKRGLSAPTEWIYEEDPHKSLAATVKGLAQSQGLRLRETTFFMSLFANQDFMSPYYGNRGADASQMGSSMPRMSNNLIRVCTEALAGKLVQSNSRVVFQTRQGDFSEWQKARKLEMAIEGEFARMKLYRELKQVIIDAIVGGDGFLKLYPDYGNKGICAERVFPNEIFVDELEAAYGAPKRMYQLRYARKEDVASWYPDKADIVDKAGTTMPPRFAWTLYQTGMIEIYEAWSLPVGKTKGRHIIAVSSGVLLDEEWAHSYFPIIRFKSGDRPFGWYGAGFVEQVASTQIDLNKTLNIMQRAAQLGIAPYWVVQEGANVNVDHLVNQGGHIVTTSSTEPKWVTNPPFHGEAVQYVDMLGTMIMTYFGLNEMETTGQLPINRLDSSQALVEFQNMGSVRHTVLMERWQEFFVEVAERVCMLASDIAKQSGGYPVMVKKAYAKASRLDWQDLDLERDSYLMSVAPSNLLPITNAGKIDKIEGWAEKGLLSPARAARALMGGADVYALLNEIAADEDDIDRLIEEFAEYKTYRAPTAIQNLPLAVERVAMARLEYANNGAPDSILRLFDRYLAEAKDLLTALSAPPTAVGNPNVGNPSVPSPSIPNSGGPSGPAGIPGPSAAPGAPPGSGQ